MGLTWRGEACENREGPSSLLLSPLTHSGHTGPFPVVWNLWAPFCPEHTHFFPCVLLKWASLEPPAINGSFIPFSWHPPNVPHPRGNFHTTHGTHQPHRPLSLSPRPVQSFLVSLSVSRGGMLRPRQGCGWRAMRGAGCVCVVFSLHRLCLNGSCFPSETRQKYQLQVNWRLKINVYLEAYLDNIEVKRAISKNFSR